MDQKLELLNYGGDSDDDAGSDGAAPLPFFPAEGQVACLVFIPVPNALLSPHAAYARRLFRSGSCAELPTFCHVSLSRPFPLRAHCVAPFSARLGAALAARRAAPGRLALRGLRVFCGGAGAACAFPALLASGPVLAPLLAAADEAVVAFGGAPFYRPPRPHASLGEARGAAAASALLAAARAAGVEAHGSVIGGSGSCAGASSVDALFAPQRGVRKRGREGAAAAEEEEEGEEPGGEEGAGEEPPPCSLEVPAVCFKAGAAVYTLRLDG